MLFMISGKDIHHKFNIMSAQTKTTTSAAKTRNAKARTAKNMSLYIPRVDPRSFKDIPCPLPDPCYSVEDPIKLFIAKQFSNQHIGKVERVDLVHKHTPQGHEYYIAFVHFSKWYDTSEAKQLKKTLLDTSKKSKLHFHPRWYWIVKKNKRPLDTKKVELYATIRALHGNQKEHLARIKHLEEENKKLEEENKQLKSNPFERFKHDHGLPEETLAFHNLTLQDTTHAADDEKTEEDDVSSLFSTLPTLKRYAPFYEDFHDPHDCCNRENKIPRNETN